MKKILMLVIIMLFVNPFLSLGSIVKVKGDTMVQIWGFLDSEYGVQNHSTDFFKTNTTTLSQNFEETSFTSRSQVRLGFRFVNKETNTIGNIAMDSWKKYGFGLMLAYVKHKISRYASVTLGYDWSLVNERTLHALSSTFRPYPAGFQGSKRTSQVRLDFNFDGENVAPGVSLGFEYRNNKDGVTIGKNDLNGKVISNSGIDNSRTNIPAIVAQARLGVKTDFGSPSNIMAFYEIQPIYLFYDKNEHKKYPYLYSIASTINISNLSLKGQFIHTHGFTGINGVAGNGFDVYSYIYKNNKLITRDSNALGCELDYNLKKIKLITAYTYLNVYNKNSDGDYFLKNEVKKAKAYYLMGIVKLTKVTRLFIQWCHIRTTYAKGDLDGNFAKASGNLVWAGYRMYF